MIIRRTKDNGFGWRNKFKYTKTDGVISIVPEFFENNRWREENFSNEVWLSREDRKEFKKFLKEVEESETYICDICMCKHNSNSKIGIKHSKQQGFYIVNKK